MKKSREWANHGQAVIHTALKPEYAVRQHPIYYPVFAQFKTIFPDKKPSERDFMRGRRQEKRREQAIISGKKCDFTQKPA